MLDLGTRGGLGSNTGIGTRLRASRLTAVPHVYLETFRKLVDQLSMRKQLHWPPGSVFVLF